VRVRGLTGAPIVASPDRLAAVEGPESPDPGEDLMSITERTQRAAALSRAVAAAAQAESLAERAESAARSVDHHQAAPLAAAGSLWADVARTYTAIAQTLTVLDRETED
jgi:hypothetical protein